MPAVSVVIPAYNAEKYISKAIQSLINQTFKDIELIIVNDGSTDKTREIAIKELEKAPFDYKIIDQENKGGSVARNVGIREATGEYIHFLDADDYIHETFMEKMYTKAKAGDYDIVFCKFLKVTPKGTPLSRNDFVKCPERSINGREALEMFLQFRIALPMGSAIYRREFLIGNDLYFTPGRKNLEDIEFNIKALYYARSVSCVPETLWFYVQRPGSVSRSTDPELSLNQVFEVYQSLKTLIKNDTKLYELFESYMATRMLWIIARFFEMGDYERGSIKRRENIYFLKKALTPNLVAKVRKFFILYAPQLYKPAYWLYNWLYKNI